MDKLMKVALIILTLALFMVGTMDNVYAAIPAAERQALIALYNSTNGDAWTDSTGWKEPPLDTDGFAMPGTEIGWYGITISSDTVTQIKLTENQLNGTIPSELENLSSLTLLNLENNQLSGTIPSVLTNLANLVQLALGENQLSGPVPPELGILTNLQSLHLGYNQLTGTIPPELGNLSELQTLHLWENQLSGAIPPELGSLAKLRSLSLSSNELSGTIPPELGNLSSLQGLYIGWNQLSGSIPSELGNLGNLQTLNLWGNELSGTIPSELGNLDNLTSLGLSDNQLSGPIPPQVGNLTYLTSLDLSDNELSGAIPTQLMNLTSLTPGNVDLCGNHLYTNNAALQAFLEGLQPGWESCQTLLPIAAIERQALIALYESTGGDSWRNNSGWKEPPLDTDGFALPGTEDGWYGIAIAYDTVAQIELNANNLKGALPPQLMNLTSLTALDLCGNHLYADDADLRAFLNNLQPDWEDCQIGPTTYSPGINLLLLGN